MPAEKSEKAGAGQDQATFCTAVLNQRNPHTSKDG